MSKKELNIYIEQFLHELYLRTRSDSESNNAVISERDISIVFNAAIDLMFIIRNNSEQSILSEISRKHVGITSKNGAQYVVMQAVFGMSLNDIMHNIHVDKNEAVQAVAVANYAHREAS